MKHACVTANEMTLLFTHRENILVVGPRAYCEAAPLLPGTSLCCRLTVAACMKMNSNISATPMSRVSTHGAQYGTQVNNTALLFARGVWVAYVSFWSDCVARGGVFSHCCLCLCAQLNTAGRTMTRVRPHTHDYHGANAVLPAFKEMSFEERLKHTGSRDRPFLNSASSPYLYERGYTYPPRPFSDSLYEDIAALDRPPTLPFQFGAPLPGEAPPQPELLASEAELYQASAEGILRRQATERLTRMLPDLKRDEEVHYMKLALTDYAPVMTQMAQEAPSPPGRGSWRTTGLWMAPPDVASVGFIGEPGTPMSARTPVDTSRRLLRNYLTASEPSFGVERVGYQASRVGTLASEAPHRREMGPIGPVQGLKHHWASEHNAAARYAQETKNFSLGPTHKHTRVKI